MLTDLFLRLFAAQTTEEVAADLDRLDDSGWRELIALARVNRCAPMLQERLRQLGVHSRIPATAREQLSGLAQANAVRNLKRFFNLSQLASKLDDDMPLIVLKGGRLAHTHYPNIGLRVMVDLDVLARPGEEARLARKLESLGYQQRGTCGSHHYLEERKDLAFQKDGEIVELHRSLLDAGQPFTIDHEGLWQRAEPVPGSDRLFYLSKEDQLVHLCLHASYHHRLMIGFYAVIDIGLMCRDPAMDWAELVVRARAWHADRCVYLSLRLAQCLVAAPVPSQVLADLKPVDFDDKLLTDGIRTIRGKAEGNSEAQQFADALAWFTAAKAWRRLGYTVRRRFLVPESQRSRWASATGAGWLAQLRPIAVGALQLLYRRDQWRLVITHLKARRLSEWMEQRP